MADVFPTKGLPGMDSNNGGTGVGYADTLTKAADFADKNNVETIVNGHYRDHDDARRPAGVHPVRARLREAVQDGKKAGKSVDEVAKAWETPAKYAGYEAMPVPVRVRANVELIFKETN